MRRPPQCFNCILFPKLSGARRPAPIIAVKLQCRLQHESHNNNGNPILKQSRYDARNRGYTCPGTLQICAVSAWEYQHSSPVSYTCSPKCTYCTVFYQPAVCTLRLPDSHSLFFEAHILNWYLFS